jgi:methylmalonyl-CoA mutase
MMDFAGAFPKATETEWRAAVDRVLKGADFEKTLVGRTADALAIFPLHPRRGDVAPVHGARGVAPWKIVARLEDPDAARGNALIHEDLLGGAGSVVLAFSGAPSARGFGLRDAAPGTLDAALAGVHADLITIRLESAPFGGRAVAEAFAAYAKRHRLPGGTLDIDFGLQPLADYAVTGRLPLAFPAILTNTHNEIVHLQAEGFKGPFLRCDGRPFHEAGASEAQELAVVVAQGVSYLRGLSARGVALDAIPAMLSFTLTADDDQFLTIAKFRALRLLWARIEEACGLEPTQIRLHAETAWRMLTRRDAYTNLLRNTVAAFAAGVGGADSIEVLPFTAALGLAEGAARRLARNTSLILTEEANLHRVIDPAAGAGSIEALTEDIAAKAWGLFQMIETQTHEGETGMPAALGNGFVAEMIRDTRDARMKAIASRKAPITGVSEFPDSAEKPVEVLARMTWTPAEGPLPPVRFAEPFEALRDRADALTAKTGKRPAVFLASLGRVAEFTARAMFAKNLLEAGGFAVITNDGFADSLGVTDLAALTAAFTAAGTPLACLCGMDATYAAPAPGEAGPEETLAEAAARRLVLAGATSLLLAGRPGAAEARLRAAGIGHFAFVGADVPALLDHLLAAAGAE